LKGELAEVTSSLNSALNANMKLAHRVKELNLETETAKGEAVESKKIAEAMRTQNGFLREHCSVVKDKQPDVARLLDVLSEEVVDLGQKMTKLTLDQEEEQSYQANAEKELSELEGFVIK